MKSTRLKAAVAALSIAVVAMGATPATAGKSVNSKVKITKLSAKGAGGVVKSKKSKCVKRRTVLLKFVDDYSVTTIGKDKTNRRGVWTVKKPLNHGIYFAKAKKKKVDNLRCRAATSNDKTF